MKIEVNIEQASQQTFDSELRPQSALKHSLVAGLTKCFPRSTPPRAHRGVEFKYDRQAETFDIQIDLAL